MTEDTNRPAVGVPLHGTVGRPAPERGRLPADVARCAGYRADGELREGCEDCRRRRTDPPHERQTHMMPPALVVFECHTRIAP